MTHDPRDVAVLAIGDELLAGKHPDRNMPLLANLLAEHGRRVVESRVLPDDLEVIARALRDVAGGVPLVFVTGGLGPTPDDLTRHAVAAAVGVEVVHDEGAWEQVQAWWARSNRPMTDANRRQALVPEGATVLANPTGTAPGFRIELDGTQVVALPGPPREVRGTWDASVAPWLAAHAVAGRRAVAFLFLQGLSESVFATEAADWLHREANPQVGVTVSDGVISLRLVGEADDEDAAAQLVDARREAFRQRFAEHVFSDEYADPAKALGEALLARDLRVTCAESCTGGMLAAALTSVPGISRVLDVSLVTYAVGAKTTLLDVDAEVARSHSVYSEPVVRQMAAGAAERAGADLAIAVSGLAGPDADPDFPDVPVGSIWFGISLHGRITAFEHRWPPRADRERIRRWATQHALTAALRRVLAED